MSVVRVDAISCTLSITEGEVIPLRTYTHKYRAYTDNKDDGPRTVLADVAIPDYINHHVWPPVWDSTSPHEEDVSATLKSLDAVIENERDKRTVWLITARFDTAVRYSTPQSKNDDTPPTNWKPIWGGSFFTAQRARDKWADDTPITNSAGEPITLDADDNRLTLNVRVNLPVIPISTFKAYKDAVNSDSWLIFSAGQVKVGSISFEEASYGNSSYWVSTIEWHVADEGWATRSQFVDMGYYERIAGDLIRIQEVDDAGNPAGGPVQTKQPLNGAGLRLGSDHTPNDFVYFPDPPKLLYPSLPFSSVFNFQSPFP